MVSGRRLQFKRDRDGQLKQGVIDGLLAEPHEGPGSIERKKTLEMLSQARSLSSVQMGGRSRVGEFVKEASLAGPDAGSLSSNATINLVEEREILAIEMKPPAGRNSLRVAIPIRSIDTIYIDEATYPRTSNTPSSVLILCYHPVTLEEFKSTAASTDVAELDDAEFADIFSDFLIIYIVDILGSARPSKRVSLLPGHIHQSPYILYDVKMTGLGLSDFFSRVCELYHRRSPIMMSFRACLEPEYTTEHLQALEAHFQGMPLQCAYQAQVSQLSFVLRRNDSDVP